MNNYCTHCGKKLEEGEQICQNCNTPIYKLSPDNLKTSSKKLKCWEMILIIIFSIVFICFIICFIYIGGDIFEKNFQKQKIEKEAKNLQKEYVEPYLKENYVDAEYKVEFFEKSQCVISGTCEHDPVLGCDGGLCEEYQYLSESECTSYFYYIYVGENREFLLTAVQKGDETYVVEGTNIYGENADPENNIYNKKNPRDLTNIEFNKNVNIYSYPFESGFYPKNDIINITLANNSTTLRMDPSISPDHTTMVVEISNPKLKKENINLTIKYFDKDFNEIGSCTLKNIVNRKVNSEFTCESASLGNYVYDGIYYKVLISK